MTCICTVHKGNHIPVTEQTGVVVNNILSPKGPPFLSGGPPRLTRFALPAARERCLSMPETGEKERNYLFKLYRLRVMTNVFIKILVL